MNVWLGEIGQALLQLLVHPLFYIFFIGTLMLGYFRVKRERSMFSTRIYDTIFELKTSLVSGIVIGLILSVVVVLAGITLPKELLYVIGAISILFVLLLQTRLMSVAYIVGISLLIPVVVNALPMNNSFVTSLLDGIKTVNLSSVAILVSLLVMVEGILIWRNGSKHSTPFLQDGKRGKKVGAHVLSRFWLVPLFLWIPGDSVNSLFPWWPSLAVGNEMYSLIVFPFVLGFSYKVASTLPKNSISIIGKRLFAAGVLTLVVAIIGVWVKEVAFVALLLAIIGRYAIPLLERLADEKRPVYFSGKNNGLVVLGVIPTTPAEKMGLQVGEIITKVNGQDVRTIDEFYVALQKNGAHCKLDVIDQNGELRFAQRALYRGEHHELGILFADEYIPLQTVSIGTTAISQ